MQVGGLYFALWQPFPRMEYTGEQMTCTLQELGLVPNGSLVLKKPDSGVIGGKQRASSPMHYTHQVVEGLLISLSVRFAFQLIKVI